MQVCVEVRVRGLEPDPGEARLAQEAGGVAGGLRVLEDPEDAVPSHRQGETLLAGAATLRMRWQENGYVRRVSGRPWGDAAVGEPVPTGRRIESPRRGLSEACAVRPR